MSFLDELRDRKNLLKTTTTVVTCVDGRKYKESFSSDTIVELERANFGFVADTKPDKVPAKIVDYLYLGSQDCCEHDVINNSEIEYILSVGVEAPIVIENKVYKFVPCLDIPEADFSDVLKTSVSFIMEAVGKKKNILVHCNAGVSRSASVVIGYLIIVCGYDYFDAFSLVKSKRSCIRPNEGFVAYLKKMNCN